MMVRRALAVAGVALLAGGAAAGTAAADTAYPTNPEARSFNTGTPGWTDAVHDCTLLGRLEIPIPLVCSTTNTHDAGTGAPPADVFDPPVGPGSLQTTFQSLLNLGGIIVGNSVWQSPTFNITAPEGLEKLTGATFSIQRQAEVTALIQAGGEATTKVELVKFAAGDTVASRTTLLEETITDANSEFGAPRVVEVPKANVLPGTYRIDITTAITWSQIQLAQGQFTVNYDNVKLRVADGTINPGDTPSVQTLLATDITATSAVLNALINPQSLTTVSQNTFQIREAGTDQTFRTVDAPDLDPSLVGSRVSAAVTDLQPCKTYEYRGVAKTVNEALGNLSRFSTFCGPTVTTLPASPVTATGAGLNSSINPNGPPTDYRYEIGLSPELPEGQTVLTEVRRLNGGTQASTPNTEQVAGLRPETTFYYRVLASNELGSARGAVQSFRTPQQSAPGAPGAPGPAGARGPAGQVNEQRILDQILRDGDERALLRIRQSLVQVGLKGRRAGQLRFRIFCRERTGRTCAGTVKIRTIGKINPSSRAGVRKAARRVTFATFEYQLAQGKAGVAITQMTPEKIDLLRLRRGVGRSIGVTISVQVSDSAGNRQTIVREGALRLVRSPR
ncbi:MAG TPA: hypothetical protein VD931_17105 [Baekduia sp.]|nr:hypothetical protein [Baekduia sp.]